MPSPINGDSIPDINGSEQACDSFNQILQTIRELKKLLTWQYNDSNLPNVAPAREMGAIIYPPGSLRSIVFPFGISHEAAVAQVEKTWLDEDEITLYNTNRNNVIPFWVIADHEQRNEAPNLSGRFLLNADFQTGVDNVSGQVGVASPGGSREVTLSLAQMPKHAHIYTDLPTTLNDLDPDAQTGQGVAAGATPVNKNTSEVGGDEAHQNMPPYYVVITAWRTNRMF